MLKTNDVVRVDGVRGSQEHLNGKKGRVVDCCRDKLAYKIRLAGEEKTRDISMKYLYLGSESESLHKKRQKLLGFIKPVVDAGERAS